MCAGSDEAEEQQALREQRADLPCRHLDPLRGQGAVALDESRANSQALKPREAKLWDQLGRQIR